MTSWHRRSSPREAAVAGCTTCFSAQPSLPISRPYLGEPPVQHAVTRYKHSGCMADWYRRWQTNGRPQVSRSFDENC